MDADSPPWVLINPPAKDGPIYKICQESCQELLLVCIKTLYFKAIDLVFLGTWYRGPESNRHSRKGTGF